MFKWVLFHALLLSILYSIEWVRLRVSSSFYLYVDCQEADDFVDVANYSLLNWNRLAPSTQSSWDERLEYTPRGHVAFINVLCGCVDLLKEIKNKTRHSCCCIFTKGFTHKLLCRICACICARSSHLGSNKTMKFGWREQTRFVYKSPVESIQAHSLRRSAINRSM